MRAGDWEQRLSAYLAQMAGTRFVYGTSDCALFAAGAVLAMTDNDPAAAFRGKYKSVATATRALKKIGAGDLESTIASMFAEKPVGFAQRGDLVMHDGAVGVCIGRDAAFVGQEGDAEGLVLIPRAQWTKAFAV